MKFLGSVALFIVFVSTANADQILILSGGGAPASNHYSQYLQTKTLTDNLRAQLPNVDVNVFFGAGNATGQPPVLADVHRVVKSAGLSREVLEIGYIPQNRPATRASVDLYFQNTKLASMGKNETFFMLVSDHGMPNVGANGSSDQTFANNCINLWGFRADLAKNSFSTGSFADQCYSKDDLRQMLLNKVSAKHSVFAMSQCYSGGFHKMSVDVTKMYPTADARICGFTAVTEDTTASGCTADVDGPGYQGYERSFTEQLTGVDVVSGQRLRPAKTSFGDAHQAATVEDFAKDIPLATSDFYLWKWAQWIERGSFVPRTAALTVVDARRTLNETTIGRQDVKAPAYLAKEAFFARMQKEFLRLYPAYAREFSGTLDAHMALERKLSLALTSLEKPMYQLGDELGQNKVALLSAWNARVAAGPSALTFDENRIETEYFGRIESKFGAGSGGQVSLLLMSMKSVTDPKRADLISTYAAKRLDYALDAALKSGNAQLVNLASQIAAQQKQMEDISSRYDMAQKAQGHIRRLMIYREALGAWNALVKMNDTQALTELAGLLECEAAPLR